MYWAVVELRPHTLFHKTSTQKVKEKPMALDGTTRDCISYTNSLPHHHHFSRNHYFKECFFLNYYYHHFSSLFKSTSWDPAVLEKFQGQQHSLHPFPYWLFPQSCPPIEANRALWSLTDTSRSASPSSLCRGMMRELGVFCLQQVWLLFPIYVLLHIWVTRQCEERMPWLLTTSALLVHKYLKM